MIYSLDGTVRVKMFGHVAQKHGSWHNGARPSDNIVLYCTDGEINMKIEDKILHIEAGDLMLIPCKAVYKPLDGGSCRYYFFHFEATAISEANEIPCHIAISPHTGLRDGYAYTCVSNYASAVKVQHYIENVPYCIKDIFKKAEKLQPNVSFSDQLLLDHLLRELLIYMGNTNSPQHNKHLAEILMYIEQHYAENLCLSVLSERFSLSKSYIARLFRKELYCKPSEHVNRVRVSVAKTMLSQTDITVTEIAEKVGYSDVYYFSKVFKKIVGSTPLKTRSRN